MVVGDYVVWKSTLIETEHEARRYYQERLAKVHDIDCYGVEVKVIFEAAATHVYTEELPVGDPPLGAVVVKRRLRQGVYDERLFSLDRARLMDAIIPAIAAYTVSIPGTGPTSGKNRLLHGARLPDGRYMRVALGPSADPKAFYCLSAYPVPHRVWAQAHSAKRAKFPP